MSGKKQKRVPEGLDDGTGIPRTIEGTWNNVHPVEENLRRIVREMVTEDYGSTEHRAVLPIGLFRELVEELEHRQRWVEMPGGGRRQLIVYDGLGGEITVGWVTDSPDQVVVSSLSRPLRYEAMAGKKKKGEGALNDVRSDHDLSHVQS